MGEEIKTGDVVRESGCHAPMTVLGFEQTDDGRTVARCRYPETTFGPGGGRLNHPDADEEGFRTGLFAVGSLIVTKAADPDAPALTAADINAALKRAHKAAGSPDLLGPPLDLETAMSPEKYAAWKAEGQAGVDRMDEEVRKEGARLFGPNDPPGVAVTKKRRGRA